MCVPDMALIVEIMLMSEGFNMSKMLSRKFVILYRLCEDLLSKSKHYDWKLRAIKTTLYVAGGMKRSAPDLSEDKVPQPSHGFTCNIVGLLECIGWTTELASQQTSNPAIKNFDVFKCKADVEVLMPPASLWLAYILFCITQQ